MLPVVGVRLAEGRSGSTLLMQLLATGPNVIFDTRYPAEYRFLSYFARMAGLMTEPFDEVRHVAVTPFFFSDTTQCGPIPFTSDIVDVERLRAPILRHLWLAWSEQARDAHPRSELYAEKLAVDVSVLAAAGIPLRVIDLVRDPRDVLASIRSFTATGIDGFGRQPGIDEDRYLESFITRFATALEAISAPVPDGVERIRLRYEDLVQDLSGQAKRLGTWVGAVLDPSRIEADRSAYRHHMTSGSGEDSIGRWRRDLVPAEADLIAERLGEQLARLGYEL